MLMDRRITRLVTPDGFGEAVDENLSRFGTVEAAYQEAERMHEKYFGIRKYASYDSYRISRKGRKEKAKKTSKVK